MLQNSHVIIVPFSSGAAQPLGGKNGWTETTDRAKRAISRAIETLPADGGTNPSPAFQMVFAVRPRPDAIYFMTDGEFDEAVVQEVALMQSQLSAPVPVHCICFASQSGEVLMKKIAEQSKGTYTFVPGP